MNILVITDAFPPEVRSSSHLMYDLAKELADRGHETTVVTTFPRYNLASHGHGQKLGIWAKENLDGIRVIRVFSFPIHSIGPVMRGIGHIQLGISCSLAGMAAKRPDAVICYSPPLMLGLSASFLARRAGAVLVFNVQDLFPQNAIDLGILRNRFLINGFEKMERMIYRHASAITVHSKSNRAILLNRGVPSLKLRIIYNWVDTGFYRPAEKENHFRAKFDLGGKFVVLFAGVMGHAQDVDIIADTALLLRDDPQIVFLLVGDGPERRNLEERVSGQGLQNIRIENFVRHEEYPALVAACDVGLATLKQTMRTPVVPSKIQGYMACGRPVVASLNIESDGHQIIKESECGTCLPAGDAQALAAVLRALKSDRSRLLQMGQNGRAYALQHFSKQACVSQYERLLFELRGERD